MPSEQFSQAVRGSGAEPISTNTNGTVQTDNYQNGGTFEYDGSAYPYSLNPAETIQQLSFTESGGVYARITTIQGETFDLALNGTVGSWEGWEIDSVEFRDPDATAAALAGGWAGE
jgi:hypothetical protein